MLQYKKIIVSAFMVSFILAILGCSKELEDNKNKSGLSSTKQPNRSIEAEKLIGQIQMSIAALDAALGGSAAMHIHKASLITEYLKASAPKLTGEEWVKLGKFSYKSNPELKNYSIPVGESIYTLDDYAQQQPNTKNPKRLEADAEVVYSSFMLNLENTEVALNKAKVAVEGGNFVYARKVLTSVFTDTLLDQFMLPSPLLEVLDNLELTRLLVNDNRFYAAASSLINIRELLEEVSEDRPQSIEATLLLRAVNLQQNVAKEDVKLLPTINREIAFLRRDITEHLQQKSNR